MSGIQKEAVFAWIPDLGFASSGMTVTVFGNLLNQLLDALGMPITSCEIKTHPYHKGPLFLARPHQEQEFPAPGSVAVFC
jgi:hypothetical protein